MLSFITASEQSMRYRIFRRTSCCFEILLELTTKISDVLHPGFLRRDVSFMWQYTAMAMCCVHLHTLLSAAVFYLFHFNPVIWLPLTHSLCVCVSLPYSGTDVVKTRVQAAQAEDVSRQEACPRNLGSGSHCEQCVQQGRPFTTSARASSSSVTAAMAGLDGTATSAASIALEAGAVTPRQRIPALPTGTVAALMHIARWEGPRGLYRGLDASLVMAIPATVLYYTVYDDFLARLEAAGVGNLAAPATAGSSARLLATIVMAPLELVRTRAQSHGGGAAAATAEAGRGAKGEIGRAGVGARRGAGGLIAKIPLVGSVGRHLVRVSQEEGMAALWRGVGTTMWRDVPFSMVYWLGYENLKAGLGCGRKAVQGGVGQGRVGVELAEDRGSADFLLRSLVAGAVSGVVASLLTHPFDVVKTQRQVVVTDTVAGELLSDSCSLLMVE